ncbi:MAG: MaoC family dehydratase [Gammaproteobacteria bacterium]|nr:MAG: MaoC family dehydratase [Gammaproteobacteria bacterium]
MALAETLAQLSRQIGTEVHVSDWLEITQPMVDDFARATRDQQWIHVDAKRAAAQSPYGSTIAHGYFTLSLYPYLRGLVDESKPLFPGVRNIINYGINKLRFPGAVPVGSRIRARCRIVAAEEVKDSLQLTEEYTVEVEGQSRPACVAECVMRLYF